MLRLRFLPHRAAILFLLTALFCLGGKTNTFAADTTRVQVAPGFNFTQIIDPSVPIRISALEINLSRPNVSIRAILSNNELGSPFRTTQDMAAPYHQEDYQVIGALNGDYFSSGVYGYVRNLMVKDDEFVIGKSYSRSQFGIDTEGLPFVDMLSFFGQAELKSGLQIPVTSVNQERGNNQAVLYNHFFGDNTRTDDGGTEVLLQVAGEMKLGEPVNFIAQGIEINEGRMSIPGEGYYVLSAHGDLGDTLATSVEIGDSVSAIMSFQMEVTGTVHADNEQHPITGRNINRSTDFMVLYDRARGGSTGTNTFGVEILLQPLSDFRLDGQTELVVIDYEDGIGNMNIPLGHYILSGHGVSRDFLRDHVSNGDTITLDLNSEPSRQFVSQLMGGGPRLIDDGEYPDQWHPLEGFQFQHNMYRHPRTGVGISKDTTRVYFVVVDGRQTASRGASVEELAHIMKGLGAWNAVNLDGGGSSTLIVQDEWVHRPVDSDVQRAVGNALIAVSEPIDNEAYINGIHISPREKTVLVGDIFNFNVDGEDIWGDIIDITTSYLTWEILGLEAEHGRGGFQAQGVSDGYIVAHYNETFSDTVYVSIEQEVAADDEPDTPDQFRLAQNYPNPFNPDTRIAYDIPENTHVRITVYDILGRPVKTLVDGDHNPGSYSVQFDAAGLASGTLIYELNAGSYIKHRKMNLIK